MPATTKKKYVTRPATAETKKLKGWQPPKGLKKTILISSGRAEAKVTHGTDTVDVKIKIFGRNYRGVDGTGAIHTVKYRVPSTTVSIKLANGIVLKARSCCKPPDTFRRYLGVYYAVRRLLKNDTKVGTIGVSKLSKKDHREIIEALCPGLFRKKNVMTA